MKKEKYRKVEDKNVTWNHNHTVIMDAFDKIYDETGKFPSMQSLSDETGLSINTIYKHSESLTLENVNTKYKLAGERVAKSLLKKIEDTGNAAEVKLYNQIVFGYKEKSVHDVNVNSISELFKDGTDEETT